MKRIFASACCVMAGVCSSAMAGAIEYSCCPLPREPVFDGKGGDQAWESAPLAGGFYILGTTNFAREKQSFFKAGWTRENLYLLVKCLESAPAKLNTQKNNGDDLWLHDSVELFFAEGATNYYQLVADCVGMRWNGKQGNPEKLWGWEVKTHIDQDFWSLEARIPFSVLGSVPGKGDAWRFNIGRNLRTGPDAEKTTTIAPLISRFNDISLFGKLVFISPPPSASECALLENKINAAFRGDLMQRMEKIRAKHALVSGRFPQMSKDPALSGKIKTMSAAFDRMENAMRRSAPDLMEFCLALGAYEKNMIVTSLPDFSIPMVYPREHWGYYLPRTMRRLSAVRRQGELPFTVLCLGDSVMHQHWVISLLEKLQRRYPDVTFNYINRAIGGHAWRQLKRYAYNDVPGPYPDLVLLSSWGNDIHFPKDIQEINPNCCTEAELKRLLQARADMDEEYYANLEEVLRLIRSNTTAEIVLFTYHQINAGQEQTNMYLPSMEAIRLLAAKYDCELVDMLEDWRAYEQQNNVAHQDFLCDSVHLNQRGVEHMAELALPHFQSVMPCAPEEQSGRVTRYEAEYPWREPLACGLQPATGNWTLAFGPQSSAGAWVAAEEKNSKLRLEFEGNRVDVLYLKGKGGGHALITIDGKPPSALGLFSIPRAYYDWKNAKPERGTNIKRVVLGAMPVAEDWIITVVGGPPQTRIAAVGAVTGDGGCGIMTSDFMARGGQFVVASQDFVMELKPGDRFYFSITPEYRDSIDCSGGDALEPARVITAKFLTPGKHVLELVADGDGRVFLDAVEVFNPPLSIFSIASANRSLGEAKFDSQAPAITAILKSLVSGFENLKEGDVRLVDVILLSGLVPASAFRLEVAQNEKKEEIYLIDAKADGILPLASAEPVSAQNLAVWSQEKPQWSEIKTGRRLTGVPVNRRWNVIKGLAPKTRFLDLDSRTTLPEKGVVPAAQKGAPFDWKISVSNPFEFPLSFAFKFPGDKSKSIIISAGEKGTVQENFSVAPELFPLKAVIECGGETIAIGENIVLAPYDYWGQLF